MQIHVLSGNEDRLEDHYSQEVLANLLMLTATYGYSVTGFTDSVKDGNLLRPYTTRIHPLEEWKGSDDGDVYFVLGEIGKVENLQEKLQGSFVIALSHTHRDCADLVPIMDERFVPRSGYWKSSSCSEYVQLCFNTLEEIVT